MAAELTERIVVLISPQQKALTEQKADALKQAGEPGSVAEVVRRALTLFLSPDVSLSKHDAAKHEAAHS